MSLAQPIGQAKIRIRPDFAGFREETRAEVDSATAKPAAVKVTADTVEAKARMDALRADLDRLRSATATAKVRLDGDTKAQAALDRIDFSLRRLGVATAKPNVTVAGVERAKIQLDEIEARLRTVGATTARARVSVAGGGGSEGILGRLAGFGQGGFFGGRGLAIGALGSAAVPLGVAGLGAGASFLTPTVAGGTGLGLFGAATGSALKRVNTVEDELDKLNQRIANTAKTTTVGSPATAAQITAAQQRLATAQASGSLASVVSAEHALSALQARGTTTKANPAYDKLLQQRAQLLKQLTPAEKNAADNLERFEKTWVRFQRELEPQSFKLLATGADLFTKGLKLLAPLTKATGDEVDDLAKRADKALSDPFWQQFFGDFLAKEAPQAVDSLGTAVGNVVTGLAHLSEQWAPLGHRLETDLDAITGRFDAWTQGAGPGAFVALVERDGPVVASALQGIAHGLVGVSQGLEPIGRVELEALTPVLNFVGDLGEQHPEVITALGVAYFGVAGGLKAIAAVKGLTGIVGTLRTLGGLRAPGAGGVGGAVSKAAPVPVYVTNWEEIAAGGGLPRGKPKEPIPAGSGEGGGSIFTKLFGVFDRFPKTSAALSGAAIAAEAGQGAYHAVQSIGKGATAVAGSAISSLGKTAHDFGQGSAFGDFGDFLENAGSVVTSIAGLKHHTDDLTTSQKNAAAAAKQDADQLSALDQLLVVNPGLMQAAIHGNQKLAQSMQAVIGQARVEAAVLGHDLGQGLIQGLEDEIPHATVAGKLLVQSTAKAMRLAAQANSPSKVTQQLGVDIGTGLAVGLKASTPAAEAAAVALTQRLLDRLKTLTAGEKSLAGSIAAGLSNAGGFGAVTQRVDSLGNPIGTGSPKDIIATLRAQRHALRQFREELKHERAHGLSAGAAKQIALLGLDQGGAIASSLDHASRRQLRQITRLVSGIHATSTGIGRDIASDTYLPRIDRVLQRIEKTSGTLDNITVSKVGREVAQALRHAHIKVSVEDVDRAEGQRVLASQGAG